jgi:hypothetical protein
MASWLIADLAEAALHLDRFEEARSRLWIVARGVRSADDQQGAGRWEASAERVERQSRAT